MRSLISRHANMDSGTRLFIKGLPPNITESELQKHFSAKGQVNDTKCIPHRRIGYVGYNSPQDAAAAVKYFNRSFIRMSKIHVEIAKPIADPSLDKRSKPTATTRSNASAVAPTTSNPDIPDTKSKKRKLDDLNEPDPKLKEFLSVMQSSKSTANRVHGHMAEETEEPPTKIAAVVPADDESGDEYQSMPTRLKKLPPSEPQVPQAVVHSKNALAQATQHPRDEVRPSNNSMEEDEPVEAIPANAIQVVGTDDDDWLRNRTNRLLDLVDEDDSPSMSQNEGVPSNQQELPSESDERDNSDDKNDPIPEESPEIRDSVIDAIGKTSRIFIRNLSYLATAEDLRSHFEQYGEIEEVHVPSDASKHNRGMGFVLFKDPEGAVRAFQSDRRPFQGRILHILPATRRNQLDEFALAKLPLKQQNLIKKRNHAASATWSWNSLYMAQNAINTSLADRLGISKSELLDPTSTDAAVKQAIAETQTIHDTKSYFAANGVDLDSFGSKIRGDTVILVKNLSYTNKTDEIRRLFEEHGRVLRVLLPPTGTIAIVQFAGSSDAKRAFAKLAYRRLGSQQLFLEMAPKDIFVESLTNEGLQPASEPAAIEKVSTLDLLDGTNSQSSAENAHLFVKNLSWDTDTAELASAFQHLEGFQGALVKTKKDVKKPGQTLSMGFGFVTFNNSKFAEAATKTMDGHVLRGHKLQVRASHRGLDAAEERKKEDAANKAAKSTLLIKNLAFQATKKDVKTLLGSYGQIKAVRMPKKFNHSGRGFAFADFSSPKEAENALRALRDTHLLGRRLVIQYAEADAVDAEEEIAKMQKKVGKQASKVALQELTGQGRKKFNVGDEGE
ncbi:MRD1-like protein [Xylariaceae sp. FL0255]|nr:MRD1-like protein [Xylariaceae sp. FL0255]